MFLAALKTKNQKMLTGSLKTLLLILFKLELLFKTFELNFCKSGKQHKTCSSALCTMDDASYFLMIRLGPKTSECEKNVTVVSTVTGCDVTNCAATLHGLNKQFLYFRFLKKRRNIFLKKNPTTPPDTTTHKTQHTTHNHPTQHPTT